MKLLFVLADRFPQSGACTSLIKNFLFDGKLLEKTDAADVLVVPDYYSAVSEKDYNGSKVYHLNCFQKISVAEHKKLLTKKPLTAISGLAKKPSYQKRKTLVSAAVSDELCRKLQKICPGSYDAVIAVFGSIDIAAGCMKFKRNNPSTKLVVYQVDPCVTNEVYKPETLDERKAFERELYETADRIITTPILLRECEQMYPGDIVGKMTAMEFPNVIPGYEDESADGEDIRCLFTGLIYGDFRDPGYTLRLFDGVDKQISFEIVGAVGKPFDAQMPKHRVVCHGRKSLDETKAQLREAHILVNIGNRMLNQVPSKLFEYISYGKPIVNICKNRNCPTIPYLEKYPLALNLFEDDSVELQSEKLNAFILGNYRKRMTAAEIESLYKACTPAYCSEQMLDIINS